MDKTTLDDMLIEMITPKVQEIEKKFSRGEGLSQDDTNTLLLKSQYNHINHLDIKLNEVTADVASLKGEFKIFQAEIKTDLAEFKTDIQASINSTMKWYIGSIGIVLVAMKALDILIK